SSSPSRTTRTPPSTITKNPVPISPCRAMTWSAGKSTSSARSAIAVRSSPLTPPNSGQAASSSVRRSWVLVTDALLSGAGCALFADLTTPQLERIAHIFEEEVYPEGARVLRQGLSGSAFHVILDGEAAVVIDGQQRATLARGDFFGEVSILLGEPPGADIVASRPL